MKMKFTSEFLDEAEELGYTDTEADQIAGLLRRTAEIQFAYNMDEEDE